MQNLLFENGLAVIPELKGRLLVPVLSRGERRSPLHQATQNRILRRCAPQNGMRTAT
jgi:hypothetical protein